MSRLVLAAAALSVLAHVGLAVGQSTQSHSRYRALSLYEQGNQAFRVGHIAEARHRYLLAWKLSRTFDIACNLGRAEAELELWEKAAEHLAFCLEHFTASSRTEFRDAEAKYGSLFAGVRRKVSALDLRVKPNGASVFIDSKRVGVTPLPRVLWVAPGRHTLVVEAPRRVRVHRDIELSAGDTAQFDLRLERDFDRSATSRRRAPRAAPRRTATSLGAQSERLPVWVLIAGGVATVLAGTIAGVAMHSANGTRDQVEAAQASVTSELEPGQCSVAPNLAPCEDLRSTRGRLETLRAVRDVALVSTVMLGTATIVGGGLTLGFGASATGEQDAPSARQAWARVEVVGRF